MASLRARLLRTAIGLSPGKPWSAPDGALSPGRRTPGEGREEARSIALRRRQMERLMGLLPIPRGTTYEEGRAAGVPVSWVRCGDAGPDRTVLYFHGGGYIAGSVHTHRVVAAHVSRASSAPVLLAGYRLAPEHPFPAAVEDACTVYRWLLARGHAPGSMALAGDSAGGGLTVAALLALKEAGEPLPAAGVCLSPWLDLALTGASLKTRGAVDPVLAPGELAFMARCYLGEKDPRSPLASPLYGDLSGLPPILVQVGTDELLLDDARRFASRARQAGVSVELEVWKEMVHVWQAAAALVPESARAVARIGRFLRAAW